MNKKGFTLIEVLIVVSILALIVVAIFSSYSYLIKTQRTTEEKQLVIADIRDVFSYIREDIFQHGISRLNSETNTLIVNSDISYKKNGVNIERCISGTCENLMIYGSEISDLSFDFFPDTPSWDGDYENFEGILGVRISLSAQIPNKPKSLFSTETIFTENIFTK